ncbi:hypothetical protein [Allobacillus halotolerans]|uniref:Uncharacterized protein n=1 Tax=Allobacillus halotolerans TaxID=570278 RepID=A0ABS6GNA1_9BACI|nr:hypothetical protein [Allobacillus halotolerans]MBU6080596.1 hypothetical protein [Allobacillus halotolerans]
MKPSNLGYMVGIPNELYFKTLNRFSIVYIDRQEDGWLVVRETHRKDRLEPYSYRQIIKAKSLEYAIQKAEKYIQYLNRKSA